MYLLQIFYANTLCELWKKNDLVLKISIIDNPINRTGKEFLNEKDLFYLLVIIINNSIQIINKRSNMYEKKL